MNLSKKPEKTIEELEAEADTIVSAKKSLPAPPLKPGLMPPEPMPPKPQLNAVPKPAAVKVSSQPSLTTEQVSKLPLFMKVEEYDRIVGELTTLVSSLNNTGPTLILFISVKERPCWLNSLTLASAA